MPRLLSYVSLLLGTVAVAFSLSNLYSPSSTNPVQVSADPLLGLSYIAAAGVLLFAFGLLLYLFAARANL